MRKERSSPKDRAQSSGLRLLLQKGLLLLTRKVSPRGWVENGKGFLPSENLKISVVTKSLIDYVGVVLCHGEERKDVSPICHAGPGS